MNAGHFEDAGNVWRENVTYSLHDVESNAATIDEDSLYEGCTHDDHSSSGTSGDTDQRATDTQPNPTLPSWAGTAVSVAGGAVVCAALTPVVMPAILGVVGFQAGGVAAGSIAAAWQASMGNVVGGSLFAALQSAGAGGVGAGYVAAAAAPALGAVGGLAGRAAQVISSRLGNGGSNDNADGHDEANSRSNEEAHTRAAEDDASDSSSDED